jgi:hypothetical protein
VLRRRVAHLLARRQHAASALVMKSLYRVRVGVGGVGVL